MIKQFSRASHLVALAVSLVIGLTGWAVAAERVVPRSTAEVQLSFAPVVRKVAPAVVNIYAKRIVQARRQSLLLSDPFFRRFFGEDLFGPAQREQNSLGTGVIVRPDGLVVTNQHVIGGASEIKVVLNDRREYDAELVLADRDADLAILRLKAEGETFPTLRFRDSDEIEVGDIVLAIGNPYGVGQTVTTGIVSALARTQIGEDGPKSFIQTDAAINPGNSGGALVTLDGRLIGINTAILSRSGGSQGIGFAIPANLVQTVVNSALAGTGIVRPWLGATGQDVTADVAASLGLDLPGGVLISTVYPGGPADRAGLRVGDIIRAIGGKTLRDPGSLRFRLATQEVGETTEVEILRRGEASKLRLELSAPPEVPPRDVTPVVARGPFRGAEVGNLSPAFAIELGMNPMLKGVVVVRLLRGSPADRIRLRPGDIVVAINGREINLVTDMVAALAEPAAAWDITIRRGNRLHSVTIRS